LRRSPLPFRWLDRTLYSRRGDSRHEDTIVRHPAVSGAFYAGTKDALLRQIEASYRHAFGPGRLPDVKPGPRRIKGLVVPHAGYMYSGPVAAHAYAALADDGWPEHIIILGPNHHGRGAPVALCPEDHATPLGIVAYDAEIGERLLGGVIESDADAHRDEHSIEVQLPFLQHLRADLSFVPIALSFQEWDVAKEVGEAIAKALQGRDGLIIASSDFTHVGQNYGQMPPRGTSVSEFARRQDAMALDPIQRLDPKGLQDVVHEKAITMCGYGAVTAMLVAAKKLGAKDVEFLKYANSAEIVSDRTLAVGYGALVVR
jgi:AmmeMemoRadiSam system protein B